MNLFGSDKEDERVRRYFEGAVSIVFPRKPLDFDMKNKIYKDAILNSFWLGFVFSMKFHEVKPNRYSSKPRVSGRPNLTLVK